MRESRTYGSGRGACNETHVPTATEAICCTCSLLVMAPSGVSIWVVMSAAAGGSRHKAEDADFSFLTDIVEKGLAVVGSIGKL